MTSPRLSPTITQIMFQPWMGFAQVKPSGELCSDELDPDYAPGALGAFKPTHFSGTCACACACAFALVHVCMCACVHVHAVGVGGGIDVSARACCCFEESNTLTLLHWRTRRF